MHDPLEGIIVPGDYVRQPNGDIVKWSKDGRTWYKVEENKDGTPGTMTKLSKKRALALTRGVALANEETREKAATIKIAIQQASPTESVQPSASSSVEKP